MNPFVGTWIGPDEYIAEVEYTISESWGVLDVQAVDPSDGEQAKVDDVACGATELTFSTHWPTSGRSARCRLQLTSEVEALLTFTYTDQARLLRKLRTGDGDARSAPEAPDWEPISEAALWDLINAAEQRMSVQQARLWEVVRIPPQKWAEPSYGQTGGGFWAVAVIGATVVWFNDLEHGFNRSRYATFGTIDGFWCNQDDLEIALQEVLNDIESGRVSIHGGSPPIPGEFVPAE